MINLLEEPCFEVRGFDSVRRRLTLPGVLAALGENAIEDFCHLRPHQRHPWHAFICQLTALALLDGKVELPHADQRTPYSHLPGRYDESQWKELLWALAPDSDAWNLIVTDATKPAFLQPPVSGDIGVSSPRRTPDDLDVVITAKNCDEKSRKITEPEVDHWIFALVSVQGQAGYSKAGAQGNYYNTVRQNGAYATRPGIGIIPSPFWGDQWGRDCRVLIDSLYMERTIEWNMKKGIRLLWLIPWDGRTSLAMENLHPYFIEVCRRIRLHRDDSGEIGAFIGYSTTPRVNGGAYKGVVEDPWVPVNKETVSAFNSRPSWEQMGRILLDKTAYAPSLAQTLFPFDRSPLAVRFRVLVRGQGSTDEYHEKVLPVPARKVKYLRSQNVDSSGEQILNAMISVAGNARSKVLYPSLSNLFSGANERRKAPPNVSAAINRLDNAISDAFFSYLWEALPEEGEHKNDAQRYDPWTNFLRNGAREIFEDTLHNYLYARGGDFLKAAEAERLFYGLTYKYLPLLQTTVQEVS